MKSYSRMSLGYIQHVYACCFGFNSLEDTSIGSFEGIPASIDQFVCQEINQMLNIYSRFWKYKSCNRHSCFRPWVPSTAGRREA